MWRVGTRGPWWWQSWRRPGGCSPKEDWPTLGRRVGAWLDIGNTPFLHVLVAFTHKTTPAVFTLLPVFANPADFTADPTIGAPLPYIPSVSATGVTPAYPQQITFDKADWTTTTSPLSSSSIKYVSAIVKTWSQRMVCFYGKADSATGTPTAHLEVTPATN